MLIKKPADIRPSEITPETAYLSRRKLVASIAAGVAFPAGCGRAAEEQAGPIDGKNNVTAKTAGGTFDNIIKSEYSTDETPNTFEDVTTYNNFYEFGTGKADPAKNAHTLKTRPWSITVTGEAERTGTFDIEDFINPYALEERIYRLRCVEAWSMVVPWVGIPLASILKSFKPTSRAKYVAFETLVDKEQMPGQRYRVLDWPYREGLTIEEAMHPLTIMAVGVYGQQLPNQNGAPMRLVVPWKYGFKSIKSIVGIRFSETQPATSWNLSASREYGFYANVNPEVSHPRWSQARERQIGASLFAAKVPTQMFNGYADEVASLYTGLDLRKNY
ncbi:MAG: protein-methionine-sulfoxide reductase catalytic subunit MsrP [Woeseiaceae bacterium]